jgi:hypothetical protein
VDRIEPIRPQPPAPQPIPAIRRTDRAHPDREHERPDERRRKRREPPPPEQPDDGMPHVDVRV